MLASRGDADDATIRFACFNFAAFGRCDHALFALQLQPYLPVATLRRNELLSAGNVLRV